MKIVGIYTRPWNKEFYYKLASQTFKGAKIVQCSEFKNESDIWLGLGLYNNKSDNNINLFTEKEMKDIYVRCRFLRLLPIDLAISLIKKMSNFVNTIFETYKFEVFLGQLIDNYTLDIIEKICEKRNIKYISMVGHFFSGYTRFSSRGELRKFRDVSDSEVESVLSTVIDVKYKPTFELNQKKSAIQGGYMLLRENYKKMYFNVLKTIHKDKYNYHWNTINKGSIFSFLGAEKYYSKNFKVNENSVYIPLHYTPEATVDYWSDDPTFAYYEDSILDLIDKSSDNISFIIKEHPAMFMKRNTVFYEKLKMNENVNIIHPYENSNQVLNSVKYVYVYTGSVGVEALLRGKKVFTRTRNYYSELHPNIIKRNYLTIDDLKPEPDYYNNSTFLKDLLQGLFPAKFINSWNVMESDTQDISLFLKAYLKNI